MWERRCDDSTCSRKRCVIQLKCRLTRRLREQARSHIGYCVRFRTVSRTSDPTRHAQVVRRGVRTW
ncbi:hypothetical protein CUN63_14405 [Pseudomonas sp. ACM7]|nr:hypothetical protein CUN63_14405 [Pseudomonas sp. ACM7]